MGYNTIPDGLSSKISSRPRYPDRISPDSRMEEKIPFNAIDFTIPFNWRIDSQTSNHREDDPLKAD